jgi:hypothetical protein
MSDSIIIPPPVKLHGDDRPRNGLSLVTGLCKLLPADKREIIWLQKPLSGEMERKILGYIEQGFQRITIDGVFFYKMLLTLNLDDGDRKSLYLITEAGHEVADKLINAGWDIIHKITENIFDGGRKVKMETWKDIWFELADLLTENMLRKIFIQNFKTGLPEETFDFIIGPKRRERLEIAITNRRLEDRKIRKAAKAKTKI